MFAVHVEPYIVISCKTQCPFL